MKLLPHTLPVLSNWFSPLNWATKFMAVTLKMLMRIHRPKRHLLLSLLMTPTQTGMSIVSRRNLIAPKSCVCYMPNKAILSPENGWEKHITGILQSTEFGFRSTTHDRSIHSANLFGHQLLFLQQVDDFALACPAETIACSIYGKIGKRLQLPSKSDPPFKHMGEIRDFNGLDVHQHDDCIKLSCKKCINRVLTTHGWATPSTPQLSKPTIRSIPIPTDAVTTLYQHHGAHGSHSQMWLCLLHSSW